MEYIIQIERLEVESVNNFSQAHVKFVFVRRIEYHLSNTFLQTFLLVFVSYMSLFFDVDDFTDRIMVTLTAMLVVATLMSSIQTVSFEDGWKNNISCKHLGHDGKKHVHVTLHQINLNINSYII